MPTRLPPSHADPSADPPPARPVNVHPLSLGHLLLQTLPITQHLSCTFLFLALFLRLDRGALDPSSLLLLCAALGVGFRFWSEWSKASRARAAGGPPGAEYPSRLSFLWRSFNPRAKGRTSVAPVIPLVTLYLLSPALKTLTKATTDDSIWALSGTLFALNLFLGDYRTRTAEDEDDDELVSPSSPLPRPASLAPPPTCSPAARGGPPRPDGPAPAPSPTTMGGSPPHGPNSASFTAPAPSHPPSQLPSTMSLTAALTGSTVLASRLPSNTAVFSFLLFSTLWFGPFPLLRASLEARATLVLTLLLAAGAVASLVGVGGGAARIAGLLIVGISVVAPVGRGWLAGRYKDRIRGPWDQAVPRVGGKGVGG